MAMAEMHILWTGRLQSMTLLIIFIHPSLVTDLLDLKNNNNTEFHEEIL